jgi:hypothetical protein
VSATSSVASPSRDHEQLTRQPLVRQVAEEVQHGELVFAGRREQLGSR